MRERCLKTVYELAKTDERIVFIGSDLGVGVLNEFKKEMPARFFMEGVSEQNLVGVAAGMAMEGRIVYLNTIATFLTRRCFEQIAVDLCLHETNVRLIAYANAGHYAFGVPIAESNPRYWRLATLGGTGEDTNAALADGWEKTRAFLDGALKEPGS